MLVEPFQGWRPRTVTPRRTKQALAQGLAEWVDVHVPAAEQIRVVLENLGTHTPAARSAVFPPADAGRIRRQLEWHLTPGPGSGWHRAELALAVLARQGLHRRIPDAHTLAREVAVWEARRHYHQATIEWRFTTIDARMKLQSLEPKASR
jgi:hypothetical protein